MQVDVGWSLNASLVSFQGQMFLVLRDVAVAASSMEMPLLSDYSKKCATTTRQAEKQQRMPRAREACIQRSKPIALMTFSQKD